MVNEARRRAARQKPATPAVRDTVPKQAVPIQPRRSVVFDAALTASGVPLPVMEHRFSERKWKFDFAWPDKMLALECDGGIWRKGGGAHTGTGHVRDIEKGNQAVRMGWRVLHVVPENLCRLETVELVKDALKI